MQKKLLMACLALVAFAAVPSLASARPVLTQPTGTVLGTGGTITGTNVGSTTMVTPIGTLTCTTGHISGHLSSNSTAGGITLEITTATFSGTGSKNSEEPAAECTGSNFFTTNTSVTPNPVTNGLPWCIHYNVLFDTFSLTGGPCSSSQRAINFVLTMTGIGSCEYTRTETVNGTFVTHGSGAGENTMKITEVKWSRTAGSPSACPSEGKLNMTFELENSSGKIFISP